MTVATDCLWPAVEHAQHSELPWAMEDLTGEVAFPYDAEAMLVPAKAKAAEMIDVEVRILNV